MGAFDTLEALAQQNGWVIKYSTDGVPSIFYPIPKMKSIDLDPSLPDRVHPAFIVNGVEMPRRLIAVYKGSSFAAASQILSLPNMPPRTTLGADELLARIKLNGTGFGPKTIADSGLLLLLARKKDWVPKGNNNYSTDYRDGTRWEAAQSITAGNKRFLRGWEYEALSNHTSALANRPDKAPHIWKKLKFIGGIPVASQMNDTEHNGLNTLTGSGPASWRLDGTPSGIDDLVGNCFDQDYGYRIVGGELQILADNNAASPTADLSAASAAWKAILPNAGDTGHTLVAPGTAGTLKWTWDAGASKIKLDTVAPTLDDQNRNTAFKDLLVNATNVPYVPAILMELGIFPISGDDTQGQTYVKFSAGEFFPRRGGDYVITSYAGLGCVSANDPRAHAYVVFGVRSAFVEP